jgi:3-deoxy-7-phosphoheptulonate synthase
VVKVGRIAGQFAKPRSAPTETVGGVDHRATAAISSNGIEFTAAARIPDPERQIMAYRQSAATLNLLRAFAMGGYANLGHVHRWTLGFLKSSPAAQRYGRSPTTHRDLGVHARLRHQYRDDAAAARHRVLHQPRGPAARLRGGADPCRSTSGDWYATSGRMLWIGDRTASRTVLTSNSAAG